MHHPDHDPDRSIVDALLRDSEQEAADASPEGAYPQVVTNNRPLREVTAEIVQVLHQTNDPPHLFVQAGRLVRLRHGERGAWIEPVQEYALRRRLSQVADVVHASGDGEQTWHTYPSLSLMRDVLAMDTFPFPPLDGITETPIVRPDGSILATPGYDPTTRLLYRPPAEFTLLSMPDAPSAADVAAALRLLHEPLEGFPFVDEAAQANALALLLTPLLRHAITGPVPLALIDAPQAGTGKSLLARVIALIATGRPAAMMTAPGSEDEWRKRVTSLLLAGANLIVIDNVEGALTAPSLAAALTTDVWSDRILGASEMVTLAQRATWLATGNNIRPGGDLPRRCYWIRLDAKTSRPWQRTGFRFPDLLTWVAAHRKEYLSALLLLARAWYAAGQPEAAIPMLGGFESWARTVGGILSHAGVTGFLSNLETMYAESDDGASQWEAFLTTWWHRFTDQAITMADFTEALLDPDDVALRESLPDELADMLPIREGEEGRLRRRLGHAFRKHTEQRFGDEDWFLARAGDDTHRKVALWKVIRGREAGSAGSRRADPSATLSTPVVQPDRAADNPLNPADPHDADTTPSDAEDGESEDEADPIETAGADTSVPLPSHPIGFQDSTIPYRLITDFRNLPQALEPFLQSQMLAVDTETTGLDPLVDHIRLIQLAIPDHPVVVIDLWQIPESAREPLHALLAGSALKIFHNAKFDLQFLQQAGLTVHGPLFDTMLASQLLDAGVYSRRHGLADLTQHFLGVQLDKDEQASDWSREPLSPEQIAYAAMDAAVLLPLREALLPHLETAGLMDVAQLEWAALPAVAEMERTGIGVDRQTLDCLRQRLTTETDQAADTLRALLQPDDAMGHATLFPLTEDALNLDSPAQVLEALQALGIPVTNTRRGTLMPLAATYPMVKALLEYRRVRKALTFATRLPDHIHPGTGRIHATYWQLGAATGRFACSDPNLQQIPKTRPFRACFLAASGHRLVIGDYSQIELRVVAELSRDARMVDAYRHGEDLHMLTASLLLDKLLEQVTKQERQAAKAVNFGLIFAMGAAGLQAYARNVYGVTLTLDEAAAFRDRFFAAYPGMVEWHRRIREEGSPRESRTLSGRRRQWADTPSVAARYNTPVQGTAADITKQALASLPEALAETDARIIGTVHDEILVEAPEEHAERVAHILKATMEHAGQVYLQTVPVVADIRIGRTWAEDADA
jgi:DNA polymerase-1